MNTRKTMTVIGLLAALTLSIGGIGLVLAQGQEGVTVPSEDYIYPCEEEGFLGSMMGRGFWSQLTEEQHEELLALTQEMIDAGATHDEIMDMKAVKLEAWGIDAPLWGESHYGGDHMSGMGGRGYGMMPHGGQGFSGRGYGGQCPN